MTTRYIPLNHARIRRKLAAIAAASSPTPSWYEAWQQLSSESMDFERLIVCQAIRDDDRLPPEAGFYLVALQAEEFVREREEEEMPELRRQLRGLAENLAANATETTDAEAAESRELLEQIQLDPYQNDLLDILIAAGEYEMADLHEDDEYEFDRIRELGHNFFHGAPAPPVENREAWLAELEKKVYDLVSWHDLTSTFERRDHRCGDYWSIEFYPELVDIVGGAEDGEKVVPDFAVDLQGLSGMFEEIDEAKMSVPRTDAYLRPFVRIEGRYEGQNVFLSLFLHPSWQKWRDTFRSR